MLRLVVLAFPVLFLAACGGSAPASNQLNVDQTSTGFSGTAGSDWSDEELRSNAFGALCNGDQQVVNLQIVRDADGVARFSGNCSG